MATTVSYTDIDTTSFSSIKPRISNVVVTTDSYVSSGANTVSTSGGYVKITGLFFSAGEQVVLKTIGTKTSTLATSVTVVSSTQLNVQLPASTSGTKLLFVVGADGAPAGTTITYA